MLKIVKNILKNNIEIRISFEEILD